MANGVFQNNVTITFIDHTYMIYNLVDKMYISLMHDILLVRKTITSVHGGQQEKDMGKDGRHDSIYRH